ncbi:MAG: cysteine peptidase family C39 domain-containing protein [Kiritimatiellae bacterium]|nr:cysteine peptidase family C39 domain-containing protein [Kiritimatiellia bacterium]
MRKRVTVLAALFAAAAAVAGAPQSAWTPRIFVLKYLGKDAAPERTTRFVVGETSALVFAIQTSGSGSADPSRFDAGWFVVAPDGRRLAAADSRLQATGRNPRDPSLLMLSPTPTMTLGPSEATGVYRVRLSVTNTVDGAVGETETPFFVFLTPGARDLVPGPEPVESIELAPVLLEPAFWGISLDELAAKLWPAGFAWVDLDRRGLRSAARVATLFGQRASEVNIALSNERPAEVRISLYSRGDEAPIPHDALTNRVSQVIARLRALTGRPPQTVLPPAGAGASSRFRTFALVWPRGADAIRLEYGWSEVRTGGAAGRTLMPEFITVTLKPQEGAATAVMATKLLVTPGALAKNVRRTPDGDVFIENIPMVDQGEKGYCAAAAGERVLEYYGGDVDQHELAQRMQMDSGGVSFENMVRGLRTIAQSLGLQVRMLMEFDRSTIERLLADYEKMAQKMGRPPLRPAAGQRDLYGDVSPWTLLDKEVFLASRTRDPTEIERFLRWIQGRVDAGIPLCHGVIIGILPEEAELGQPAGLHLRLIIGYNLRRRELLYTDSWGPGHERKRMPLSHAWAMTVALFTIEPR